MTAALVQKYDVAFAPGTDAGVKVLRDMKDQFTAIPGKLEIVFSHRKDRNKGLS